MLIWSIYAHLIFVPNPGVRSFIEPPFIAGKPLNAGVSNDIRLLDIISFRSEEALAYVLVLGILSYSSLYI